MSSYTTLAHIQPCYLIRSLNFPCTKSSSTSCLVMTYLRFADSKRMQQFPVWKGGCGEPSEYSMLQFYVTWLSFIKLSPWDSPGSNCNVNVTKLPKPIC